MSNAPFPIHPHYTSIAMAYSNGRLIGDAVLPRVPVMKQEFKYQVFDFGQTTTVPDTRVGRTSQPNRVEFGSTEETSATDDYALDNPIPNSDIDNQPDGYDVVGRSTEQTTDLILLDREVRVANAVFGASTYGSGNKATLSGSSQWSHADSNPIVAIASAADGLTMRPNVLVLGRLVATKLRTNPAVVQAYNGSSGTKGMVPMEFIREMLELEEILVGESWVNTAKKGQTQTLSAAWGKHAALLHRNMLADTNGGATFGLTAQFGDRIAAADPDKNIGMRGGIMNRVGESVKELITAPDLGYLFIDAIA